MAQAIKVDASVITADDLINNGNEKSSKATVASLEKIREILELVAVEETEGQTGRQGSSLDINAIVDNIQSILKQDPNNLVGAMRSVLPYINGSTAELAKQLENAKKAITEYQRAIKDVSDKDFEEGVRTHVLPRFAALENSNTPEAKVWTKMKSLLEKKEKSSGEESESQIDKDLVQAMVALQELNIAITVAGTKQDQLNSAISEDMLNSASQLETQVDQKLAEAEAEEAAASDRPWWEKLITAVVTILAVAVAAVTGGVGAALVAAVIGAFMASPAFNDTVSALGSGLTKMLEKLGVSDSLAEKLGTILAKVVVTVIVIAASAGLSGFTTVGELGAQAGASAAEDGAEAAAEGAAEGSAEGSGDGAGNSAVDKNKITWSSARASTLGVKVGLVEGFSTLLSSNIVMDFMSLDSKFVKDHPELAMILDTLLQVIGGIVAGYAGGKVLKSIEAGSNLLTIGSKYVRATMTINWVAQAGQGATEGGLSIERAGYLKDAASAMTLVGALDEELSRVNATLQQVQTVKKEGDDSFEGDSKSLSQELNAMSREAGKLWASTANTLMA